MSPDTVQEARSTFEKIELGLPKTKKVTVVICPSYPHIALFSEYPKRKVVLGAQNVSLEEKGSFTGEVSMQMLKDLGVRYLIIGHSERRKLGETDEEINKKIILALKIGMTPILCVGEQVRDEDGHYLSVIKDQLEKALAGVPKRELEDFVVAYEPIWAVGAKEALDARGVHEMVLYIKKIFVDLYKLKAVYTAPILYGGSVDISNASQILSDGQADGLLIGRQSLDAEHFLEIIRIANTV